MHFTSKIYFSRINPIGIVLIQTLVVTFHMWLGSEIIDKQMHKKWEQALRDLQATSVTLEIPQGEDFVQLAR